MATPLEEAHVLDPFAGSGALGFEAASRGAVSVLLLDHDPQVVAALTQTRNRLDAAQVEILCADAATWFGQRAMGKDAKAFDLIFLDPPFSDHRLPSMVVITAPHLSSGGCLYLESDNPIEGAFEAHLQANELSLVRAGRAGQVYFGLAQLRR
jgi:16S rRNA G966 N2-methylase RsmD